ncbi:MAG TPA: alpha/beta hydrolase [Pyrinomonadaceae bacterium]|jgi:dienelactone hydrolase|nr:alpha/beta hydrolase [Pyrinomonadaceae bacterium]
MGQSEREVEMQSEDGWTIVGTLSMPEDVREGEELPGVLLLHSSGHDQETFNKHYAIPGLAQTFAGKRIVSLRIDWRGRGKSMGGQEFHSFNSEQRAKIKLDVETAINFLASEENVDSNRIAIVAEEVSADAAVLGAMQNSRIKLFAFLSGRLSQKAKDYLSEESIPVVCVVSSDDRPGLADMTEVYSRSKHPHSDISVHRNAGIGTTMFYLWRHRFPDAKPMDEQIAEKVSDYLRALGSKSEVSFVTEDGWTIYGDLSLPPAQTKKLSGVVLLHTALSDRYVYHDLSAALVRKGMAVLSIDWRGRGKSLTKGKYSELTQEERERGYLDAKGAINYLSSQPFMNPNRLAVLGTDRGALHALNVVLNDARVKALVILTVIFTPSQKESIGTLNIPVLYIASQGIENVARDLTDAYHLSKNVGSELAMFPGSALGYQLLEANETVQSKIVEWLNAQMQQTATATAESL